MNKKLVFWIYIGLCTVFILLSIDYDQVIHLFSHEKDTFGGIAEIISKLDVGSAVALASLAAIAWWEAKRDDEWISVVISYPDGHKEIIDNAFQREECSRAEINGVLSSYHRNHNGQYSIGFLSEREFRSHVKNVKNSSKTEIIIKLNPSDKFKDLQQHLTPPPDPRPKAFWNISNHPAASWPEAQTQQARALTGAPDAPIIDLPFPQVDPTSSTQDIHTQADALAKTWTEKLKQDHHHISHALVTGEPIMSLYLSRALQAHNIKCYVATTERIAEEKDGLKTSRFQFIRFREWPSA